MVVTSLSWLGNANGRVQSEQAVQATDLESGTSWSASDGGENGAVRRALTSQDRCCGYDPPAHVRSPLERLA
jgi:hypothetical protein